MLQVPREELLGYFPVLGQLANAPVDEDEPVRTWFENHAGQTA